MYMYVVHNTLFITQSCLARSFHQLRPCIVHVYLNSRQIAIQEPIRTFCFLLCTRQLLMTIQRTLLHCRSNYYAILRRQVYQRSANRGRQRHTNAKIKTVVSLHSLLSLSSPLRPVACYATVNFKTVVVAVILDQSTTSSSEISMRHGAFLKHCLFVVVFIYLGIYLFTRAMYDKN